VTIKRIKDTSSFEKNNATLTTTTTTTTTVAIRTTKVITIRVLLSCGQAGRSYVLFTNFI
jgi:hypothetical protein